MLCVGRREEDLVTCYSEFSLSGEPLKPNHTRVLSLLQHCNTRRPPLQQSSTWRSALPSTPPLLSRVHSCSSSSSWSSSIASIWVLEHTSLIGAESSPSTTSSLDISLFFCGDGRQEKWKPHNAWSHWEKKGTTIDRNCSWDHRANLIFDMLQNGRTQYNWVIQSSHEDGSYLGARRAPWTQ